MASLTASLGGSPKLTRWGGLAALLGGAFAAALTLFPAVHIGGLGSSPPSEYLRVFLNGLATLLLAGGLVGLHARQAGAHGYGRLGTVGFLSAFVATLILAVLWPAAWFAVEASVTGAPTGEPNLGGMAAAGLAGLAQSVALVFLGAATLRARVLPLPWGALPLAVVLLDVLSTYVATPAYLALGAGTWSPRSWGRRRCWGACAGRCSATRSFPGGTSASGGTRP